MHYDGFIIGVSHCHPGGGISGGVGYITAGIIAENVGLKTWRQNLVEHFESLAQL